LLADQQGTISFQLHGNGYTIGAGDTIKLELLGRDAPYYRTSNGTFAVDVSNVTVSLPTTGSWYTVINEASNSCVEAAGAGTSNGTAVRQSTCGSQQASQEWQLQPTGGGYYALLNRNASAQDLVWDVTGGATADGTSIQLWSFHANPPPDNQPCPNDSNASCWQPAINQQWQQVDLGNGYYEFVAHDGKCLDVPGGIPTSGVQLQQSTCDGSPEQAFRLAKQP
jgi:glucosylceramidase